MTRRPAPPDARFIGSEIYRRSSYGVRHPLAIPRVSTCIDLARALGWLPDTAYIDSPVATADQLARFHDPAYVAAVIEAERSQRAAPEIRQRFNIGCNGNPVFPEIFRRPATACGGSILAATLLSQAGAAPRVIYSPAGGTHHGRRDRASGFCYFNDPVLAILTLLDRGLARVFYLDLDAHHGDGVQDALATDPRVFTLSIHEAGRWPQRPDSHLGSAADRGAGQARNVPVPPGFNDAELDYLMDAAVMPLIQDFDPEAVVVQCGADALEDDPMSKLSLSNGALWRAVRAVKAVAPKLLVLGGGGYNPWSVGRCWAGVWAQLCDAEVPSRLPAAGESVLRGLTWRHRYGRNPPTHWFTSLADPANDGPIRDEVRTMARQAVIP